MIKQQLEHRLSVLENEINQLMSNLNVLIGGKQEVLFWLEQANAKEKELKEKELEVKSGE